LKKHFIVLMVILMFLILLPSCRPITDETTLRTDIPEPDAGDAEDTSQEEPELDDEPENNEPDGTFSALFGPPGANAAGAINAPYGALYNLSDDVFIYGKSVDTKIYPSGTVKLLTALVVYDALPHDFIFDVGNEVTMAEGGTAGLINGQKLSMEAVLSALLIPIGNDAAYTISVNTARELSGTSGANSFEMNDYFLRLMNEYAENLGAVSSNFSNPCGFHASNNFSTVRDLTLIAAAAAMNPLISAICGMTEHEVRIDSGGTMRWENSNSLLLLENWDIRGLRTGNTAESMLSAQILAFIDGKYYIATVSGAPTPEAREQDIIRLLQMARDGYDASVITVFSN
jgi:D-alanyl-D-alanine carboxypeptidase (penicillin-binding protein 5/6)